jgi:hypothetical protein
MAGIASDGGQGSEAVRYFPDAGTVEAEVTAVDPAIKAR